MTVEYTVPAAGSGMAALFSSGSADIKVSASFMSILNENNPNTWPLDDQNNLVAPSSLTTLPNNIGSYITGDITGIDLSGCTNLTTIGNSAFEGCRTLTEIILPKTLKTIGESAFDGCTSLTSIDLSGCTSLTTIDWGAFFGSALKSIELPESLTTIGPSAFEGCSSLKEIDLSNTKVDTIRQGTFSQCGQLTEVRLPKDLKTITEGQSGADAFQYCEKLKHIYFYNVPEIGARAFDGVAANNLTIYYPSSWDSDGSNFLELLKQQLGDSGLWAWPYTLKPAAYLLGF